MADPKITASSLSSVSASQLKALTPKQTDDIQRLNQLNSLAAKDGSGLNAIGGGLLKQINLAATKA